MKKKFLKLFSLFSGASLFALSFAVGSNKKALSVSAEINPILVDSKDVNISYSYTSSTSHSCILSIVGQVSLVSSEEQSGIVDVNAHYYTRLDVTISVNDNSSSTSYYFGVFSQLSTGALPYDDVNGKDFYFGAQGLVYRTYDSKTNLYLGLMGYWNNTQTLYGVFSFDLLAIDGGDTSNLQFGLSWEEQHQIDSTLYVFNAEDFENNYMSGYQDGYTDGYSAGQSAGYTTGYNEGEIAGYSNGYSDGSNNGYSNGYDTGYVEGVASQQSIIADSYSEGYTAGYNEGYSSDTTASTIFSGILQIALVPINFFLAMFNFEILGINIASFVSALLTVAVTIIIVRVVTGKKND